MISIARLLRRVRQVPSRADELVTLRRRMHATDAARASDEERMLAIEIRALKLRISEALSSVSSCVSCVPRKRQHPFAGGDCCGGVTEELFSDDEIAALVLAGTSPRDLEAPHGEHAGCAFRADTGCTLAATHRPERCVHYTCDLLQRELHSGGDLDATEVLLDVLQQRMQRFVTLRGARLDDELFETLEQALVTARPS